jgi:c-di-GMP-binding flagellar brake protein YcgR
MINRNEERRRFRRVFFEKNNSIEAVFIRPGIHESVFSAMIMNMSAGGLHFTLSKSQDIGIRKGDQLILTEIRGTEFFNFFLNIDTRIVWVLDKDDMEYIGYGCEFKDVPDIVRGHFIEFVDSEIKKSPGE